MLEELLRRVASGGAYSLAELAQELGMSEELLKPMIQDLARLGYLRPVAVGCQGTCAKCPLLERSDNDNRCKQIWELTAKGERTAWTGSFLSKQKLENERKVLGDRRCY